MHLVTRHLVHAGIVTSLALGSTAITQAATQASAVIVSAETTTSASAESLNKRLHILGITPAPGATAPKTTAAPSTAADKLDGAPEKPTAQATELAKETPHGGKMTAPSPATAAAQAPETPAAADTAAAHHRVPPAASAPPVVATPTDTEHEKSPAPQAAAKNSGHASMASKVEAADTNTNAHKGALMPAKATAMAESHAAAGHHEVHWSYSGAGAPSLWGDLKKQFATCKAGKKQSPIDISTVTITALPKIAFDYGISPLKIINNGHAIQANYKSGSAIRVDGKKYELLQVHFHAPSEHTIGGRTLDMVAHLVHKAADGQLAVVGVLMEKGNSNTFIDQLWAHMPAKAGPAVDVDHIIVDINSLLPANKSYYTYTGSLTTPPCTEGVKWMVLTHPVTVSAAQIAQYTRIYSGTARPVQPLNGRVVLMQN